MKVRSYELTDDSFVLVPYRGEQKAVPYWRLDPRPTRRNPIVEHGWDPDLGRHGVVYTLADGCEGAVLWDQALSVNNDPQYVAEMQLYRSLMADETPTEYEYHLPNGLPPRCWTGSGKALECEHGDHPTYIYPVVVELVNPKILAECVAESEETGILWGPFETHAVIYTDADIVLTLFECNYSMFSKHSGLSVGGRFTPRGDYRITEDSLQVLRAKTDG